MNSIKITIRLYSRDGSVSPEKSSVNSSHWAVVVGLTSTNCCGTPPQEFSTARRIGIPSLGDHTFTLSCSEREKSIGVSISKKVPS